MSIVELGFQQRVMGQPRQPSMLVPLGRRWSRSFSPTQPMGLTLPEKAGHVPGVPQFQNAAPPVGETLVFMERRALAERRVHRRVYRKWQAPNSLVAELGVPEGWIPAARNPAEAGRR